MTGVQTCALPISSKEQDKATKEKLDKEIKNIFGDENNTAGAGGAVFTDLKILLFPVRSSKDSFKWVTCEHVLKRFKRDYKIAFGVSEDISEKELKYNLPESAEEKILLEDFEFPYQKDDSEKKFLNMDDVLLQDVYLISDMLFKHLVNNATQIIARNKLKDNKTSDNLWYEETLPADTVLYSFILPSVANETDLSNLKTHWLQDNPICQIGGNETVGYGISRISFL